MDMQAEELQLLGIISILKHSIQILKQNPKKSYLISPALIVRLSCVVTYHSFFTHSLLTRLQYPTLLPDQLPYQWLKLLVFLYFYSFFFVTVVSIVSDQPVSVSANPSVSRRLSQTLLWVSPFMVIHCIAFINITGFICITIETNTDLLLIVPLVLVFVLWLFVYVYFTALWQLAGVVCVAEPDLYGFCAIKKSFELLKGKMLMAGVLGFGYLLICGLINWGFSEMLVRGESTLIFVRLVVGGVLIGVLLIVNLVTLLVQCPFYYLCKRYHNQEIDKNALYDLLGGFLGK